jgi:hypothetical protein
MQTCKFFAIGPRAYIIKHFTAVINSVLLCATVFVTHSNLYARIILAGKPRPYQSEAPSGTPLQDKAPCFDSKY